MAAAAAGLSGGSVKVLYTGFDKQAAERRAEHGGSLNWMGD
jgi:hypothetical protein